MAKIIRNGVAYGSDTMNLTTDVTGILPAANGGTGANSIADARANLGIDAMLIYSSNEPSTTSLIEDKTVWIG